MISAIIVVKDRDLERVQNCVDSFSNCDKVKEVIIVDYGSKEPFNFNGAQVIRYNKNKIFNKSHALNLGIKKATQDFIMTVDCDIVLNDEFMDRVLMCLNDEAFIYSSRVRRIQPEKMIDEKNFYDLWKESEPWMKDNPRYNKANGGVQIYPREWISGIGGHDERLIYWGAIDNDAHMRATNSGLMLIELNSPILHQEHELKKEDHITDDNEKRIANWIRMKKAQYVYQKESKGIYMNEGPWGEDEPNQNFFLDLVDKMKDKIFSPETGDDSFNEVMQMAIMNKQDEFQYKGIDYQLNFLAKPKYGEDE